MTLPVADTATTITFGIYLIGMLLIGWLGYRATSNLYPSHEATSSLIPISDPHFRHFHRPDVSLISRSPGANSNWKGMPGRSSVFNRNFPIPTGKVVRFDLGSHTPGPFQEVSRSPSAAENPMTCDNRSISRLGNPPRNSIFERSTNPLARILSSSAQRN